MDRKTAKYLVAFATLATLLVGVRGEPNQCVGLELGEHTLGIGQTVRGDVLINGREVWGGSYGDSRYNQNIFITNETNDPVLVTVRDGEVCLVSRGPGLTKEGSEGRRVTLLRNGTDIQYFGGGVER